MKIIDGHTHIASTRFLPSEFLSGVVDNMMERARLLPVAPSRARVVEQTHAQFQDHDASRMLRGMAAAGVASAIVLLPDLTYALRGEALSIEEMYKAHAEILRSSGDRLIVFAGVDPRWGSDGFALFVRGIEKYGFRGLKLYPPCGYSADSPLLTPYYEYCQEHALPVLLHVGPSSPALSSREALPMHVDEPARRYPKIPFILAHGAVNYVEECVNLCKYRPNVYLDLSGAQVEAPDAEREQRLRRLFSLGINHKIIYGTDWPIHPYTKKNLAMGTNLASDDSPVPRRERELILSGNIEHILGLRYGAPEAAADRCAS